MYTVFIQSYNSLNKCSTLDLLVKYKFNNNYYIVIGEDDPKLETYKNVYMPSIKLNNVFPKIISDKFNNF